MTGGRFVWTTVRDGKIIRSAAGKVTVRDADYIEEIESVLSEQDRWMVGKTGTFLWELDGDEWRIDGGVRGDNGVSRVVEKWTRVK